MINKKVSFISILTIALAVCLAVPALAATTNGAPANQSNWSNQGRGMGQGMKAGGMRSATGPVVFGTVSAINGDSLTVAGRQLGFGLRDASSTVNRMSPVASATTTYEVDATKATVMKNNATSTVASIVVGDTVMIQGAVSGTNITATTIRDGVMRGPGNFGKNNPNGSRATSTSPIQGNGEPVVAGTISAINGGTLTITNKSNVTYSVDVTNAKITRGQNTIALSGLTTGDSVVIQGTVNGNSVVATSVIDQPVRPANTVTTTGQKPRSSFLGNIGGFFTHIFGFF